MPTNILDDKWSKYIVPSDLGGPPPAPSNDVGVDTGMPDLGRWNKFIVGAPVGTAPSSTSPSGFRTTPDLGLSDRWAKYAVGMPNQSKAAPANANESFIGKAWDWLWEPRYNQFLDFLGAPKSMQYTGELANQVQQAVGGKTGAALGGAVSGVENFINSQSSIGGLALLIGSLGTSGLFTSAGEAALTTTAGKTLAAEAGEAAEAGGAAAKGADLLKAVFKQEDVAEIQKGVQAVQRPKR